MKFIFYFFIAFILLINLALASAVSFSPSYIVFNQGVGEKICQKASYDSDSEKVFVSDSWAENKEINWNPNLFNLSSSQHGLKLYYDSEVPGKGDIEICLTGQELGEYHGILFLSEEQKGNSIVRAGIWIKAIISERKLNVDEKNSWITGSVVGNSIIKNRNGIIIGFIMFIIIIVLMIRIYLNKKEDFIERGI